MVSGADCARFRRTVNSAEPPLSSATGAASSMVTSTSVSLSVIDPVAVRRSLCASGASESTTRMVSVASFTSSSIVLMVMVCELLSWLGLLIVAFPKVRVCRCIAS